MTQKMDCPSDYTELPEEEWRPIPGYEGLYDASSNGRIRSHPGKTTSNSRFRRRVWKSRIMKPKYPLSSKRKDGRVSLWKDGVHKDFLVSRLVAMAWLGVPTEETTVNHIDGDYTNNSVNNLEWTPLSDNIRKGFDLGLYDSIKKPVNLVSMSCYVRSFKSMEDATRWLGRGHGYISNAIKKRMEYVTSISGEKYRISF